MHFKITLRPLHFIIFMSDNFLFPLVLITPQNTRSTLKQIDGQKYEKNY